MKPNKVITLGAGEQEDISGAVRFVKILSADYPVEIQNISDDKQTERASLSQGSSIRFTQAMKGFRVTNTNKNNAQTIEIISTVARVDDSAVTGTVEVLDGRHERTVDNLTFQKSTVANAVVGEYSVIYVRNVLTKSIVVNRVITSADTAGSVGLSECDESVFAAPSYRDLSNKNVGGDVIAVDGLGTTSHPTLAFSLDGFGAFDVEANKAQDVVFTEPFVIPPGSALCIYHYLVNAKLRALFEGYVLNES